MADLKISELPEKTSIESLDLIPIVDNTGTPTTKKIKLVNARVALKGDTGASGAQYPWLGQWLTATSYAVNGCIQQGGSGYVCAIAHTSGVFATDLAAGKWSLIFQGSTYPWRGQWLTSTAYSVNDCIFELGSGYVCLVAHTSGTFATDLSNGDWSLLVSKGDTGATGPQGTTGTNINLVYGTSGTAPGGQADGTLYATYIP